MTNLPRYEKYKDSGVEWLGEIPEHWEIKKLKSVADLINGYAFKNEDYKEKGIPIIQIGNVTQNIDLKKCKKVDYSFEKKYHRFKILTKDILLAMTGATIGKSSQYLLSDTALLNQRVGILRAKNISDSFLIFFVESVVFKTYIDFECYGGAQENIGANSIRNIALPHPPIAEQKRIAEFLDRKCGEIDEAIRKKQRLIELLEEQKTILINQAVTKGLNPNAPMKDSGIDWLREIPEHWEVWRSKRLFNQSKELARPDDIQLSATQAYGVIPQEEYEHRIGRKVTKVFQHLEKRRHVEIGDFVISMRSFQGGLERAWAQGCIRSSYVVLKPSEKNDLDFFMYLFKSQSYIEALQTTASFIRDGQDLNFDNFCGVDLPLPPIEEQRTIAKSIRLSIEKSSQAAKYIQQEINKLTELKQIIITEAVTGKIKV